MAEIWVKQLYQIKYSTNHKPIHGGQRVCEENNELELEKNENLGEIFCGERINLERLYKKSDTTDWSDFDYKNSLQHKGNSTVSI